MTAMLTVRQLFSRLGSRRPEPGPDPADHGTAFALELMCDAWAGSTDAQARRSAPAATTPAEPWWRRLSGRPPAIV